MNETTPEYGKLFEWRQCDWCNRVRRDASPRGFRIGIKGLIACSSCYKRQGLAHSGDGRGWYSGGYVPLRFVCTLPVFVNYGRPGASVYGLIAWTKLKSS